MHTYFTPEEEKVILENIDYAIGLYTIYPNDNDVLISLRQKGLKESIIYEIMSQIKKRALLKRKEQAKKHIIFGATLFLSLLLIKILLTSIPDSENLMNGQQDGEGMLRFIVRFYAEIFYLFMFAGVLRALSGLIMFVSYKKKLAELS